MQTAALLLFFTYTVTLLTSLIRSKHTKMTAGLRIMAYGFSLLCLPLLIDSHYATLFFIAWVALLLATEIKSLLNLKCN